LRDKWRGNNVDLNRLTEGIKQFFTQGQFETTTEKSNDGYKIEAVSQKILNVQLKITVDIYGKPEDFTIEFTADKNRKGTLSPSKVLGYIAGVFGGGSLLLSDIKLREAVEKLETAFWEHVDRQVAELTNTASK